MGRRLSDRPLLGLGMLVFLLPVQAGADFLIEFTDGCRITVRQYVEEAQTIKIYTPRGAIGFRKADVKQIMAVSANQNVRAPLEAVRGQTTPLAQGAVGALSEGEKTQEAGKSIKTEREHIEQHYQDVARQIAEVWGKHMRDVDAGAAKEVLAENRRRLDALNREQHKVVEAVRRVDPDNLPAWAQ
jgi:hypothetical protein